MPKRTRQSRSSKRRRTSKRTVRRSSRVRRVPRSLTTRGSTNIHDFKGTLNCGILQLPWVTGTAASTQYGGAFVFTLADLPVYANEAQNYEFIRVNEMIMHFLPRFNQASLPQAAEGNTGATQQYFGQTFITAMDEVPVQGVSGSYVAASQTWVSQSDEDSGVNEMEAVRFDKLTPDYVRGIRTSKETELYKPHMIKFTPVTYGVVADLSQGGAGTSSTGEFEQRRRKWIPTSIWQQASETELMLNGPTFHGPVYAFTQLATASPTNPTQVYDVKVEYSVSFKRYKGA